MIVKNESAINVRFRKNASKDGLTERRILLLAWMKVVSRVHRGRV